MFCSFNISLRMQALWHQSHSPYCSTKVISCSYLITKMTGFFNYTLHVIVNLKYPCSAVRFCFCSLWILFLFIRRLLVDYCLTDYYLSFHTAFICGRQSPLFSDRHKRTWQKRASLSHLLAKSRNYPQCSEGKKVIVVILCQCPTSNVDPDPPLKTHYEILKPI